MKKLLELTELVSRVIEGNTGKLKLVIVEGYEMVGKTTVIDYLRREFYSRGVGTVLYRPDYDKYYPKIEYHERGYLGLSALELYSMVGDKDTVLILDRSVFSTMVYDIYYHGFTYREVEEKWLNPTRELFDKFELYSVLVAHKDKESARELYRVALSTRGSNLDEYDIFEDFEEYYGEYLQLLSQFISDIDVMTKELITATSWIYYTDYFKGGVLDEEVS